MGVALMGEVHILREVDVDGLGALSLLELFLVHGLSEFHEMIESEAEKEQGAILTEIVELLCPNNTFAFFCLELPIVICSVAQHKDDIDNDADSCKESRENH